MGRIKKLAVWSGVVCGAMVIIGAGAAAVGWWWLVRELPTIEGLKNYRPPAATQVLAADGRLMAELYHQRRYPVDINKLPRHVYLAFVAAEDGAFFRHRGIDIWGILRAAWANLRAGRVVQGGSTITQQVARALLLSPERTFSRKLKEMVLALRMERHLSKMQILGIYINQVYLGHGAYGVEAAARTYLGKSAAQLTIAEAALLAGLVQAPSRYSPLRHPRRARTRQLYVIGRMLAEGFITPQQAEAARQQQLAIGLHRPPKVDAPYYAEYVRQWLVKRFGQKLVYEGGLRVYTACDPQMTALGRKAINAGLLALARRHGYQGPLTRLSPPELESVASRPVDRGPMEPGERTTAVVVGVDGVRGKVEVRFGQGRGWLQAEQMGLKPREAAQCLRPGDVIQVKLIRYHPQGKWWELELVPTPTAQAAMVVMEVGTGLVRVLIGGRDFATSQFNRAIQAHRQPGSAFKPFIYSAALDHPSGAYTPTTVIIDAPVIYDDPAHPGRKWKPKNYEGRFFGPTTLRQALEHSRNVVTVKLLARLGVDYVINYARRFGITSPLAHNLSLALGTSALTLMELTRAYSVFADQGRLVPAVFVVRVVDPGGQVLYQAPSTYTQAISPATAYIMTYLLEGVMARGTGKSLRIPGRAVAGKTGTTNDLRDAWFIGYSPGLVCGVWVGRDDNRPLGPRETGARAAGPIWRQFMAAALAGRNPRQFHVPEGVEFVRIDLKTGRRLPPGAPDGFFEAFKAGTAPPLPPANTTPSPEGIQEFIQSQTFPQAQEGEE